MIQNIFYSFRWHQSFPIEFAVPAFTFPSAQGMTDTTLAVISVNSHPKPANRMPLHARLGTSPRKTLWPAHPTPVFPIHLRHLHGILASLNSSTLGAEQKKRMSVAFGGSKWAHDD